MPPKKGQRQARGLARQDQILDAAFDLFANNGVRQTTIAAVADRVGLSEAGVLHHFTSKEELLLAVLHRVDASFPDAETFMAEPGGGVGSGGPAYAGPASSMATTVAAAVSAERFMDFLTLAGTADQRIFVPRSAGHRRLSET